MLGVFYLLCEQCVDSSYYIQWKALQQFICLFTVFHAKCCDINFSDFLVQGAKNEGIQVSSKMRNVDFASV